MPIKLTEIRFPAVSGSSHIGYLSQNPTSYGAWRINGYRNGYTGWFFGNGSTNLMFSENGYGGIYREFQGVWSWYGRNRGIGLQGSTTSSIYPTYFNGTPRTTGEYVCESSTTAASYPGWSDARMKTNVQPITGGLEKVLSLRGVYYNWKSDPNKVRKMGLIAQEVKQVVPQAVEYYDNQDIHCLNYDGLAGVLVEAVKQLKAKLDTLKQEIQILENS